MGKLKHLKRILPLALLALAMAVSAAAATEGGHEAPRWGDFGWRVLNFVIFMGILWYFVGGMAVKYFRGRHQGIRDGLDSLDTRRREAREKMILVEERIANLESERQAILDESRVQAEKLKEGIVAEARRQAEQIVEQARRTAESEGHAALARVRAVIADDIVAATEKILKEQLNAQEHEKLIDNALNKVVLH